MGMCRHQATVILLMGELLPLLHPPQPAAVTEAGLQRFGQYLQAIADAASTSTATSPRPDGSSLWSQAADLDGCSPLPIMSQGVVVLLQLAVEIMAVLSTQQAAKAGRTGYAYKLWCLLSILASVQRHPICSSLLRRCCLPPSCRSSACWCAMCFCQQHCQGSERPSCQWCSIGPLASNSCSQRWNWLLAASRLSKLCCPR